MIKNKRKIKSDWDSDEDYLVPCEIPDFIIMREFKIGGPLQTMLWIFYERCAQQFTRVLLRSI